MPVAPSGPDGRRHRPAEPRVHHVAGVVHAAARAGAALNRQTPTRPGAEREINAVPVVRFVTVVVGGGVVRVRRAKRAPRVAGEKGDGVTATVGKAWIRRRSEGDFVEVRGRERAVVGEEEIAPRPPVVADLDRDLRRHFLLHADAVLPVAIARAPTREDIGIDGRGLVEGAPVVGRPRAAFAVRHRIHEVALRHEIGVPTLRLSDHERLIDVTSVEPALLMVYASPVHAPWRYCATFTLSAVLPLPKTS